MTEVTADVLAAAAAHAAATYGAVEGQDAANANPFAFVVPNTEIAIGIALAAIPGEVRMDFLRKGVQAYITNRITTAHSRWVKACEPWTRYEDAMKVDPLQTAVAKPTEDKPAAPEYTKIAAEGREALYTGTMQRKSGEPSKKRVTRTPLVQQVTQAVTRAWFEAQQAVNPSYKWTDAVKAIGNDGIAYLEKSIEEKVAAAPEAERAAVKASLEKTVEDRYLKPARTILGIDTPKGLKDAPSLF